MKPTDIFSPNHARPPDRFGKVFAPRESWLALQLAEPVIEPDLPIVDTHFHLWDFPAHRYLVHQAACDFGSGHRIEAAVFNDCLSMYRQDGPEAMKPVGEVQFAAGQAAMSESGAYGSTHAAAGIIGFADLSLGGGVEEVLRAQTIAGGGRFRGVRFATGWDADARIGNTHTGVRPAMLAEPAVREGLRWLSTLGLVFEAWVFHRQLSDVAAVADAEPDLRIVLDHTGGPLGYGPYASQSQRVFAEWRDGMRDVARRPNVVVKLGGMLIRLAAFDYTTAERPATSETLARLWKPYIETAIELFGPDRCMFESNFPVEKLGCDYRTLWNAFKRITAGASAADKAALYSSTARRTYRL